jgi:hypothetical protein
MRCPPPVDGHGEASLAAATVPVTASTSIQGSRRMAESQPPQPAPSGDGDPTPVPATGRRSGRTRFVFVDTEATGLDHERHELTEVSWIVRFEDGREEERQFFPQHTVDGADADALTLTRYHDRIAPQDKTPAAEWLTQFLENAQDAVLVGAVPDFDAKHLERMCRKLGVEPTWDHHLLDVETLALPLIAPGPEAAAYALAHDKAHRSTALAPEAAFRRVAAYVARRGYPDGLARKVAREAVFTARDDQRTAGH